LAGPMLFAKPSIPSPFACAAPRCRSDGADARALRGASMCIRCEPGSCGCK
jgi:hypothetical protein